MKLTYYSDVKEGRLQKNVSTLIASELNHFNGKRIELTIQKLKSSRSAQQNRYWWVLMKILSTELGYTKDEMHELCKFKFLKREKVIEQTGEIMNYLESTTKLSKSEFADLISELQVWSAQTFNIVLPSAGEQIDLNL